MVRLRLLSTSSVVEAAKLVVATTFRSAVDVKAEPESRATVEATSCELSRVVKSARHQEAGQRGL